MQFFKIVRRHPVTGAMVDTYSGAVVYAVGETVEDHSPHGLSVHTTASRATTVVGAVTVMAPKGYAICPSSIQQF